MASITEKPSENNTTLLAGLNGNIAVGRCGAFNQGSHKEISNTTVGLNTCVANGLGIYTFGKSTNLIGAPTTGWNFSLKIIDQSWTGMSLNCQLSTGEKIRIDYRTTLPGVLYSIDGNMFAWDWAVSSSPGNITHLPSMQTIQNKTDIQNCDHVFCANTSAGPILFSCSQPVEKLESISWEHWRLHFAKPGAKIMITPLLRKEDIPTTPSSINTWVDLTQKPPLYSSEKFIKTDKGINIISNFYGISGAETNQAPLPPSCIIAKNQNGLQQLPTNQVLLQTVFGPFAIAENNKGTYSRTINTDWINTRTTATIMINKTNEALPFELAYAGDSSWDEKSPMDSLLSWRVWGQVFSLLSNEQQKELKSRVAIPTKTEFENSLMERFEPVSAQKWLMDKSIFAAKNEDSKASFDVD